MVTSDQIKDENWKNKTARAEGKFGKLNTGVQEFKLRENFFKVFDEGSNIDVFNTCPINSLIHGLQHLEVKSKFLSDYLKKQPIFICVKQIIAEAEFSKSNKILYDFITDRNLFLTKVGNAMNCWNSVGEVVDKVIECNILISCENCGSEKKLR